MIDAATPTTIVISALASGPTPPTGASATGPNVLHTRVADVVGRVVGPSPWAMPPATHYASPCEQCGYTDDGP